MEHDPGESREELRKLRVNVPRSKRPRAARGTTLPTADTGRRCRLRIRAFVFGI
jgi:hypothetical protein